MLEIILLHVPELGFEVGRYVGNLLTRYAISVSDHGSYEDDWLKGTSINCLIANSNGLKPLESRSHSQ